GVWSLESGVWIRGSIYRSGIARLHTPDTRPQTPETRAQRPAMKEARRDESHRASRSDRATPLVATALADLLLPLHGLEHAARRLQRHVEDPEIIEVLTEVIVLFEDLGEVTVHASGTGLVELLTNILDLRRIGVDRH